MFVQRIIRSSAKNLTRSFTVAQDPGKDYSVHRFGEGKKSYQLHDHKGKAVSFWHDIPLGFQPGDPTAEYECSFIVEIPKNRLAKLELDTEDPINPIVQDTKKHPLTGERVPRFYYIYPAFNYGLIPQTFEDSEKELEGFEGCKGDGDPLDFLELSESPLKTGSIHRVSYFGCLPLVDQGEIDFKILGIRADHPLAVDTLTNPA